MAEEQAQEQEKHAEPTSKKRLIRLVVLVVAVIVSSAGGFGAAQFFKPGVQQSEKLPDDPADLTFDEPASRDAKYEYIEFDPVTAPLDVPNVNRYIRLKINLAIPSKVFKSQAVAEYVDGKKRELKSWLTGYLTSCTLEQVRGEENLNRIKHEIRAAFNEKLWPGHKPLIAEVLVDDFKVQ
ncbi:MAG: flagellar basal body-associated FliL family protein [Planctomycetes bacterium]|nr:flagellar basal body-associated FliL family protein [Planctomycetota bacterium]